MKFALLASCLHSPTRPPYIYERSSEVWSLICHEPTRPFGHPPTKCRVGRPTDSRLRLGSPQGAPRCGINASCQHRVGQVRRASPPTRPRDAPPLHVRARVSPLRRSAHPVARRPNSSKRSTGAPVPPNAPMKSWGLTSSSTSSTTIVLDSANIVASYRRKVSSQLPSQSLIAQYRRSAIA